MKSLTSIALLWVCASCLHAQNINKIEYWIDHDPGFGFAENIGFAPAADVTLSFAIPVSSNIPVGMHTLGIRSRDNNGRWSHTNVFPAFVFAPPSNATIDRIEYWIDTDSDGFNLAQTVTGFTPAPDITNFAFTIPANLNVGLHTIGIRSRSTDGEWSHTNYFPVYVSDSVRGVLTEIEYYWGKDPGFGNSPTDTILGAPFNDNFEHFFGTNLPPDIGTDSILFVRSKGTRGSWSHTNRIRVDTATTATHLVELTGIKVFPNPFVDEITIAPSDDGKVRVVIYDQSGRLVGDVVVQGETTLNMAELSSGVYTAFFWDGGVKIYRLELLKI